MHNGTYSPKQLSELSGISVRALHHYDRIGLLKPHRQPNGYRLYGPAEVDRLQLILLYRATGMPLAAIGRCLDDAEGDTLDQLQQQRNRLQQQRDSVDSLIATVDVTIAALKGAEPMSDQQKFQNLKQTLVDENERTYGKEARERYGDDAVNASNAKLMGMTQRQYADTQELESRIKDELPHAMATGNPAGPQAHHVCELHRQWLCSFWKEGTYTKQAHAGLAQMYVADERFKAYYDAIAPGAAEFLRDAIRVYCAE